MYNLLSFSLSHCDTVTLSLCLSVCERRGGEGSFKLFQQCYKPNKTDLQMLWNIFCSNLAWYRRTKDLVLLFDLKVHLFENSLLKMLAQLLLRCTVSCSCKQTPCTLHKQQSKKQPKIIRTQILTIN